MQLNLTALEAEILRYLKSNRQALYIDTVNTIGKTHGINETHAAVIGLSKRGLVLMQGNYASNPSVEITYSGISALEHFKNLGDDEAKKKRKYRTHRNLEIAGIAVPSFLALLALILEYRDVIAEFVRSLLH